MTANSFQEVIESPIGQTVVQLDRQLATLVESVDILDAIKPSNYSEEKAKFFEQNGHYTPNFLYNANKVDVFNVKRQLFNLPLEDIADSDLYHLYFDVIHSYADKLDQLSAIGQPTFLYSSLRYYGEPNRKEIDNAKFIMHLADENADQPANVDCQQLTEIFQSFSEQENYQFTLKIESSMIANALVSGTTVKVNEQVKVTHNEAMALAHHELGVHLATSLNARQNPLKIMSLGCPLNTKTQEGLAIFCEYLSGNLTVRRLKTLALRVLAVDSLLQDKAFDKTYSMLREQYQVSEQLAFNITARVYRGGGFTKDHLYLSGLSEVLQAHQNQVNLTPLFTGKTSMDYLQLINRLIGKGWLAQPQFIAPAIRQPCTDNPIEKIIIDSIR